jgi:predicted ATPase
VSSQTISSLERGARSAPQRQTLALLADALGLDDEARAAFEAAAAASTKVRVRALDRKTPSSLPIVPTSFVGRERERAEVRARFAPGRCLTLWGSGGVGKTRLLLEAMRDALPRFVDGAWFVDLTPLTDSSEVARAVALVVGIDEHSAGSLEGNLAEHLAHKRALLAFDNAEHVLDGCARLVGALLARGATIALACTSREALRVAGEDVYALDPLPVPEARSADLARTPAVRLFLDRAASAGQHIAGNEVRDVAEICRRLDAIPLAIELAAARVPMLSCAQILAELDGAFRLLTRGSRNAPTRHQTLQAAFDWSYELAEPRERAVLRRVAIWPGSWSIDDAAALACDADVDRWSVVNALGSLVDRSLVVPFGGASSNDERRYRLLQTTTLYALERLHDAGETESSRERMARHVHATADRALEAWRGAGDDRPFRSMDVAPVRAALRWALGPGGDRELGATIAGDTAMLWDFRGLGREGLEWIDQACAALGDVDSDGAARVAIGEARLARRLYFHARALAAGERAVALSRRLGNDRLLARALLLIGDAFAILGRQIEGREALAEAAALFLALGDSGGYLGTRFEQAYVAIRGHEYEEARAILTELAALFRERGNQRAAVHATIDLAEVEYLLGDLRAAIERAHIAIEEARELGAWSLVAATLQNVAGYSIEVGDVVACSTRAREALDISEERGFDVTLAFSLGLFAEVLARTGRAHDAAKLLGFVDRRIGELGTGRQESERRGYERSITLCRRELGERDLRRLMDEGVALEPREARRIATAPARVTRVRTS